MFYTKKSLGQNFLINQGILDKIVTAAELSKDEIVVEIGPGTGNLTVKLSEKAGKVIAIEKDYRLIERLQEKFKNTNVEIIEGDALKIDIETLVNVPLSKASGNWKYKVVGNIPYYITSNLLKTIFESASWRMARPKLIVLTVQKEVAQRIVVRPPYMNLLALSVQLYSEPKIIGYISKGSFRPMPKVDSAIIKLTPYPKTNTESIKKVLELAKKAFAGKRKQLKNTIGTEILEESGVKPESRPQELSLNDWLKIVSEV